MKRLPKRKKRFVLIVTLIVVAVCIFLLIDYYSGLDLVGTTARFLLRAWEVFWRAFVEAMIVGWRFLLFAAEKFLTLLPGILSSRGTRVFVLVGMVGFTGLYFSHKDKSEPPGTFKQWVVKSKKWMRVYGRTLARLWRRLPLIAQVTVTAVLIVLQVHLHWVIVLFPIGFLIPPMVWALKWFQRSVIVAVFGVWFEKHYGPQWRALVHTLRNNSFVHFVAGVFRCFRLWFAGGWRLWHYDHRFDYSDWKPWKRNTFGRTLFALRTIHTGEWGRYRRKPGCRPLMMGTYKK